MSETPKPSYPEHMEKPAQDRGALLHASRLQGMGSFGFDKRYGLEWYCGEHKKDGDDK